MAEKTVGKIPTIQEDIIWCKVWPIRTQWKYNCRCISATVKMLFLWVVWACSVCWNQVVTRFLASPPSCWLLTVLISPQAHLITSVATNAEPHLRTTMPVNNSKSSPNHGPTGSIQTGIQFPSCNREIGTCQGLWKATENDHRCAYFSGPKLNLNVTVKGTQTTAKSHGC